MGCSAAYGQTQIQGTITGENNEPLAGANVYIKGGFDGAQTDTLGHFSFVSREKGEHMLVVTYIGYINAEKPVTLSGAAVSLTIKMKEQSTEVNTVTITAGSIEASDKKRNVALTALDVVTTAGAAADIYGAINTLPGNQKVGETEGMFVRGGTAAESRTYIDGLLVQNPFNSSVPNVAQRGRFSPFIFKNVEFCTGGFSAQYGQALSGLLLLDTKDEVPDEQRSQWTFGLMPIGPSINFSRKLGKNDLLTIGTSLVDLSFLFQVVPQNIHWDRPAQAMSNNMQYIRKTSATGIFKVYAQYDLSRSAMQFAGFDTSLTVQHFAQSNQTIFIGAQYRELLGRWMLRAGYSLNYSKDQINIDPIATERFTQRDQAYANVTFTPLDQVKLKLGAEAHQFQFANGFASDTLAIRARRQEWYVAGFAEAEWTITRKVAVRGGLRSEYSSLIKQTNLGPRASFAVKTGKHSQMSGAYGLFFQQPDQRYLLTNTNLNFERADHFLLNYQWQNDQRFFKLEGYYKSYLQLVHEYTNTLFDPRTWRQPTWATINDGNGYAQGFDIFWRDKKTIKNVDYWISYTYLDTKRLFQNYPVSATPSFASANNLSLVFKKWFPKLNVSMSATYTYASGRPYYDPNNTVFMGNRLKDYNDLSLSMSKIISKKNLFVVFFATAGNILGIVNVYGVQYSGDGQRAIPITQPALRSFMIGTSIQFSRTAQKAYDPTDPSNR